MPVNSEAELIASGHRSLLIILRFKLRGRYLPDRAEQPPHVEPIHPVQRRILRRAWASPGSDQIHEECGINALMALYDPRTIRIDERTKANRATINGVGLLPMSKTLEMAKKIVELRAKLTVDAINKATGK